MEYSKRQSFSPSTSWEIELEVCVRSTRKKDCLQFKVGIIFVQKTFPQIRMIIIWKLDIFRMKKVRYVVMNMCTLEYFALNKLDIIESRKSSYHIKVLM